MKDVKKVSEEVVISDITQIKFYPEADNWMWNYCTYLGSSTDSIAGIEKNYDVGYWVNEERKSLSFANVTGSDSGNYHSGCIIFESKYQASSIENFIKSNWKMYLDSYKLILKANPLNIQKVIIDEVSKNSDRFTKEFKDFHNKIFDELKTVLV